MKKRSPGPWYLAPEPAVGVDGTLVSLVIDAEELPVANCGSGPLGEANAELVACAPLLLRALREAYLLVDVPASEYHPKWVRDAAVLLEHLGELP